MTAQTPGTAEMKEWLRCGSGFSQIFDSRSGSGSQRKTQNPAGVDSGTPDSVPPLVGIRYFCDWKPGRFRTASHIR